MSHLYIYAIIRREDMRSIDLPPVAEPGERVICHGIGPIAVVVSATTQSEIMSTRRNMLSHTKILEELVRDLPILPFRFGVVSRGVEQLEAILAPAAADLRGRIEEIAGTVEVGLRVTFLQDEIFRHIVAEHPDLKRRSETLARRPAAETYYDKIDLGRQVEARLGAVRQSLAETFADRLTPLAERVVRHETTEDMAVFNAAFLVRRDQEASLFAEVRKLEAESGDRINMKYVSPVPPYNFVSIRLDAQALQG